MLFWLLLLGLIPSGYAAVTATGRAPAWSLRSEAIYRMQIGLVVFLGIYLLALAFCLAYLGRSIGRVAIPGGGEVDPKDPALEKASSGAEEFQEQARASIADLGDAMDALSAQLTALEDRRLGERLAAIEDRKLGERVATLEAGRHS